VVRGAIRLPAVSIEGGRAGVLYVSSAGNDRSDPFSEPLSAIFVCWQGRDLPTRTFDATDVDVEGWPFFRSGSWGIANCSALSGLRLPVGSTDICGLPRYARVRVSTKFAAAAAHAGEKNPGITGVPI